MAAARLRVCTAQRCAGSRLPGAPAWLAPSATPPPQPGWAAAPAVPPVEWLLRVALLWVPVRHLLPWSQLAAVQGALSPGCLMLQVLLLLQVGCQQEADLQQLLL